MLISLTVGKVDAGVAVLLTEDKRLIEFPSILLPASITSGSIVDITVSRNATSESASQKSFAALQSSILQTYGLRSPSPPILRCRNATQTSIVLEWDKLDLATASFRSLSLYRNGAKAGNIPFQPGGKQEVVLSTKISGLAVDTEYTFHLILRTSAGTYGSDRLRVRTHKMTDLTGITVTPGVLPPQLLTSLATALDRIGAKLADTVRIDTTHFVCTEGRGKEWDRAVEMNIPVVRPEWVEGCEREGRIVGVRGYYLNADPKLRQVGQGIGSSAMSQQQQHQQQQQQQQQASPQPDDSERRQREVQYGRGNAPNLSASQASLPNHTTTSSFASPPPPPTPAKDYKADPMSKAVGAGVRSPAAPPSEEAVSEEEPDPEAEARINSRKAAGMEDEQSQPVSPVESEVGPPDDLGISGLKLKQRKDESVSEDDADGEDEKHGKEGIRSPEDTGNFSEVQL